MDFIQAIIYGIIQGIGEFLPISSSAHLIAAPQIFGWKDPGLSFDVALHMGTLLAVVAYFWKDWLGLVKDGILKPKSANGLLFWFIVLASVPGALIGKLLDDWAESSFRNLLLIGVMMILMGVVLHFADRLGKKEIPVENIGLKRSFLIGLSQALAIIPGVSRSGITMSSALALGLTRESAARFSFLLSTPIIFGAGVLKSKDLINSSPDEMGFIITGVLVSALTGFLSIKFLLNYLKNKGFRIFVIYRVIAGLVFIGAYFLKNS